MSFFWATHCRPPLFRLLRIRSREDVYELSSLITDSQHQLAGVASMDSYMETLMVAPSEVREPWLHLVSSILRPKLPHHVSIYLGLEPSRFAPNPGQAIHSIHHLLPKSLPGIYSQFHSLYLSDVRFRTLKDFVRLVSEMPVLHQLRCTRLTWDKSPHTLDGWYPARFPRSLDSVDAEDCTDNWALFGFFARRSITCAVHPAPCRRDTQEYYLSEEELQVASEILQSCQRISPHPSKTTSNTVSVDARPWSSGRGYGE